MSRSHALAANILAALAIAGCAESPQNPVQVPPLQAEGPNAQLRVKMDPAHGRRWVLGWEAAVAYEDTSGRFIRRVPLTGASLSGARDTCRPDLLVSRSGAVIVSSNAEPVLWRIDPASFEVRRYDIALDSDASKDFGFSALAWDADESVLYAASAITGTLWRIDLGSAAARKIALTSPVWGACALAAFKSTAGRQTLVVSTRGGTAPRRIWLAAELDRGQVSDPGESVFGALR